MFATPIGGPWVSPGVYHYLASTRVSPKARGPAGNVRPLGTIASRGERTDMPGEVESATAIRVSGG